MSWDAELVRDAEVLGEWNYTHNTNVMAQLALYPAPDTSRSVFDEVMSPSCEPWWRLLDGLSGADGAKLLARIVDGLRADPDRFRALNPANGWGNYDDFVSLLEEMRAAVPGGPTGRWSVIG